MLNTILQILAVLGILILVLLGILLALVLLVLFFPVSYRISGSKDEKGIVGKVKADWLFGILRLRGSYPAPGRLTVKLLWVTLFDSAGADHPDQKDTGKKTAGQQAVSSSIPKEDKKTEPAADGAKQMAAPPQRQSGTGKGQEALSDAPMSGENPCMEEPEAGGWILGKIAKIKYTFRRIYDKIKEIWENISYYTELFQKEETRQCLSRVKVRTGKILRSIRPRKIKADIIFGTGSPDTTGYLYGAFCMIWPFLGKGVEVAPDFSQARLTGWVDIAGRITAAVLLVNGLKLFLDENLKTLIRKMKNGRK